ncbi:PREDICTED: D(3) dopamine receptor isoform X1 [Galeopterus variegatus]|uniref:D(3) dopamine receptor n=1 Tax=Galeopterus variegatus TaxID=482537 RepID=A0ABM0RCN5_GALVR|nr:PREDICTED: D(3) dopamine receptor isoform X1 [Galeopterus variegatus]
MAPLSQLSDHVNSTCGAENSTGASQARPHAYYALSYCVLILAIVFGNGLVCVAVLRERALQTTTNYLVVSLAVADLLVATLVMPWVVYLEVTGGVWNLSRVCCDVFVSLDVMMCTASILNLCAISIDRYTAVVMPVHYQHGTGQSSCRRVALMITAVWVLAFAVSCPLLFGFNTTGDPTVCSISNPDFVIYSSLVSFYLPFGVTVLIYARIYVVLRQRRRKRILTRQNSQCISVRHSFPQQSSCLQLHPIQQFSVRARFPSDATGKIEHSEDKQYPQKYQDPLLSRLQSLSPGQAHMELKHYYSICQDSALGQPRFQEEGELKKEERTWNSLSPTMAPKLSLEVRKLSNGRLSTSLKLGPLQPRGVPLREKKATQMVAIVLGTFIVCWLPFFLTHILNTHCHACHVSSELYSAATWLGYVNSALNPVIYTTFNVEFRKAFHKILSC